MSVHESVKRRISKITVNLKIQVLECESKFLSNKNIKLRYFDNSEDIEKK